MAVTTLNFLTLSNHATHVVRAPAPADCDAAIGTIRNIVVLDGCLNDVSSEDASASFVFGTSIADVIVFY